MLCYYKIWGYHKLPNIQLFGSKASTNIQEVNESKYNFAFVVRFNFKFLIRVVYFLKGEKCWNDRKGKTTLTGFGIKRILIGFLDVKVLFLLP